jgi:uncharacterized protein DUF6916
MMTNRRQFLTGCSTLALAAAFPPPAISAATVFRRKPALGQLTYEAFSKCVGSSFILLRGAKPAVALELANARQQEPSRFESANAPDAGHERFSLMFCGPHSDVLPQDTYSFEHGRLGRFEMFIVPMGVKEETHCYYQAVFNRPLGVGDCLALARGRTKLCLENKNKI